MIRLVLIVSLTILGFTSCQGELSSETHSGDPLISQKKDGVKPAAKQSFQTTKDHEKIHIPLVTKLPPPKKEPLPIPDPDPWPDPWPEPGPDPIPEPLPVPPYEPEPAKPIVLDFADKMPEFPGGVTEMMTFIKNNIKYPELAKEMGLQGNVYVKFIVDESGNIIKPHIAKGDNEGGILDKEALRIVSKMPKWIPGEHEGRKVAVYFVIPVRFKLDN